MLPSGTELQVQREILVNTTQLQPAFEVRGKVDSDPVRSRELLVQVGLNPIKGPKCTQAVLAHDAVYPLSGLA